MQEQQIEGLAHGILGIISSNQNLREINLQLKKQLVVFLINRGGHITGDYHPNIQNVDWDKIQLGTGISSASISVGTGILDSWDKVPMKK